MTTNEVKIHLASAISNWADLETYAAKSLKDSLGAVAENSGFMPFEVVDTNNDGFIDYAEWKEQHHPVCVYNFGLVPQSFYDNSIAEFGSETNVLSYKSIVLELVWNLITNSTSDLINKGQYITVLGNLGSLIAFNEDHSVTYKGTDAVKSAVVALFNTRVAALK
jgi:hypothetical protein